MTNLSLYSITAIVILDSEGNRIHVKYYNESLAKDSVKFEKQLYRKSKKTNGKYLVWLSFQFIHSKLHSFQTTFIPNLFKLHSFIEDLMMWDNWVIAYKNILDVFVFVVGSADENELILESVTNILTSTFQRLLK